MVESPSRERLLDVVRERIRSGGLRPPLSYDLLMEEASAAVKDSRGNDDEIPFAMLAVNNESWRSCFEAVPYDRRALMLPRCMRSAASCRGSVDDVGLVCAGCGACSLMGIIEIAEGLGYATVVAEGSTAARDLVREGQCDAILGVGCMEALEKSFADVRLSAVPSIAIPLLSAGCVDTECDLGALAHWLHARSDDPSIAPFSVALMRESVESAFTRPALERAFGAEIDGSVAASMGLDWMLSGGKRFRPLMTYMAYRAYAAAFDDSVAASLGVAIECFHKASLILDDVEDGDDERYGRSTLHRERGIPLAINAADYLIGQGYTILCGLPLHDSRKVSLFALFARMHVLSTVGQGEDLRSADSGKPLSLPEALRVFRQKTGSPVMAALVSGAIAAGAPKRELDLLETLSDLIGMAYQIRDDLGEYRDAGNAGSASYPFLKSVAMSHGARADESMTDDQWRATIEEIGAEGEGWAILDGLSVEIRTTLDSLSSRPLALALLALVNRLLEKK